MDSEQDPEAFGRGLGGFEWVVGELEQNPERVEKGLGVFEGHLEHSGVFH